jgi:hypothetical protein
VRTSRALAVALDDQAIIVVLDFVDPLGAVRTLFCALATPKLQRHCDLVPPPRREISVDNN